MDHEVGHAAPRGLPEVPREEAEERLSAAAGKPVSLDDALAVTQGPESCPACGSTDVQDAPSDLGRWDARDDVHPLVWGEGYGIADTYVCHACDAGWIEGWKPHPITWVRPWRTS